MRNFIKDPLSMQIDMIVQPDLVPRFFRLLSQGFVVKINAGCSIKDLLCRQMGIREDFLDERVQTLFLNGKAVDDVDATIVEDESTLALSGPMPGLVGVTFRRAGFYAALRSQISHADDFPTSHHGQAKVILKLFNLVAKELGPTLLQRGIWIKGKNLQDFIIQNLEDLKQGCHAVKLEDKTVELARVSQFELDNKLVFLQITTK